jgi:hypothetical protein
MKIVSLDFEIVRATQTVAEFLARVELDGPAEGCGIAGRAVGPRCPGVSTVEVAYPMAVEDRTASAVTLRCAIPEPNLWTPRSPFEYAVSVTLKLGDELVDSRSGTVRLRSAT